jgi:guanylate kinase
LKRTVLQHMREGKQVILEIDVQGAFQVREKVPKCHLVFIEPPSLEELRRRLVGRGTETPEAIERRMKTAEIELSLKDDYDICVMNDDLDAATDILVAYVDGHANR